MTTQVIDTCNMCDVALDDDRMYLDGQWLCDACVSEHYVYCDVCGNHRHNTDRIVVHADEVYCESCTDRYLIHCANCQEYVHVDWSYTVGSDECCESCLECTDYCESCDTRRWESEECSCEEGGIRQYSFKPTARFHGDDAHGTYLGLELEIERRSAGLASLIDNTEIAFPSGFYFKHDGSLDHGVEMVSHPASLDVWQQRLPRLTEILDSARSYGMRSWNTSTCGIHVHVSAAAFGSYAHRLRFAQLFYRNANAWQTFAGRESTQWASFDESRVVFEHLKGLKRDGYARGLKRYVAVNMCNAETLEVRIFRGTLIASRVMADLESVHAAVEYTRGMSCRDALNGALEFGAFRVWLSRSGKYANAAHLMSRKNQANEEN